MKRGKLYMADIKLLQGIKKKKKERKKERKKHQGQTFYHDIL